jgi:GT2 family glycosyltransferase
MPPSSNHQALTDLAVIVVSTNEAHWLRRCLPTVYEHAGKIGLDVVVVDNESTDGTRELVESEFPLAQVVRCENRGFAQANNCALRTVDARWILFLNPDTEILAGTLAALVDGLRARPTVGLVGVRQVTPNGQLYPTIRRFSNATRWFFEGLGSERFPFKASWLGERELDMSVYEQDVECDWVSGSFMLVRREALQSAGFMDERFFLFCDETDLCLRIKQAGWEVRHLPDLTILHHAGKAGWNPKLEAQGAYAKRLYLQKHFSPPHRLAATAALALGYGLRSAWPSEPQRREAARAALGTLLGRRPPPYGRPPRVALHPD